MRRLSVAGLVVGLTCAFSVVLLPAQSSSAQACVADCSANPSLGVTAGSTSVTLSSSSATLTATATLTGSSSATGTITFTLLYGSSTVDTETASVSGDGTYPTPTGYTLPATGTVSGTYQWNVSYSGDDNNSAAVDQNDPAGQVAVSAASPSITSLPSPASLALNSTATTLQDGASLSDGYYPTGTITFTLYQGSHLLDTETTAVDGDGSYPTPTGYSLPATPGAAATYQWNETYSGDSNNNSASDVNDGSEAVSPVCANSSTGATCAFGYTGGPVSWTVPAGVTTVSVTADGAQGGAGQDGQGGLGGAATADVAVTPGEVLQVDVGGAGSSQADGGAGGWNGGGASGGSYSAGGGGASDIRTGACASSLTCDMTAALLVAGGGGGGGSNGANVGGYYGGAGGGATGGNSPMSPYGGGGGTQTAGGAGGSGTGCPNGGSGTLGQGGNGGPDDFPALCEDGAGGGGGYFGGGGGGSGEAASYTGGGGSGFGPANRVSFTSGVQSGNGAVSLSWPVADVAATVTSTASAQFGTGQADSFTTTTNPAAWPVPALSETGALPAGVTFTDNGDGTATLAGSPTAADAGTYQFHIAASNGVSPDAAQDFTLTVGAAPQITSTDQTEFVLGNAGSFTVTATGDPTPMITERGPLPSGLIFQDNGNGTATISGTPNEDNGPVEGTYPITIVASQAAGGWPAATQELMLTVGGVYKYAGFDINATGTDGTALNPGMNLAINGDSCSNLLSGTTYVVYCPSGPTYYQDSLIGSGRTCGSDSLPLAVNPAIANCYARYIAWEPADNVTLTTPATTTVDSTVYTFDHWDTSAQSVACQGGNASTSCTFEVPPSGLDVTAIYDLPTCPAGSYSSTGNQPCTQVPAGSYAAGTGNIAATPCPAGSFSAAAGSASCTPAPAGSYASGTGNTAATPCPAGSFSAAAGSASCTPAPAGSYASGTGNTAATPCPAGTTSAAGASACTATSAVLTYNGPTQVAVSASLIPTAALSSATASCVAGQPVSFSLSADPLNGTSGTYSLGSAEASGTGAVTGPSVSTAGWQNGVYTLTATYAGATVGAVNCPAATTSASLAVTVSGQAAVGDGWYSIPGAGLTNFGFVVALKAHTASTYTGALAVIIPGKWLFQANVTSYGKTSSTQGLLGGTGTLYWWNAALNHGRGAWQLAKSGVTYTATASAATKSAAASFGITIKYTPAPPQPTSLPDSAPLALSKGVIVLS
jgi:hypothetical protein